jgi:endonuclease/exonuclease/phosphatase family metal-dependent hydrolase
MVRLVLFCLLAGCAPQAPVSEPDPSAAPSSVGPHGAALANATVDVSPWISPEACQSAIADGPRGVADGLRITTWNARWFPLGHAPFDATATDQPTDLDWMACVITSMETDVIVLEEVLGSAEAEQALDTVFAKLATLQARQWSYRVMDCDDPDLQHVVIGYRDDGWNDLALDDATTLKLSGGADPLCSSSQRPALVGRFNAYGTSVTIAGVHLKSGGDARSYSLRRDSMTRLMAGLDESDTVVALGDFNTMGCYDCEQKVTGIEEIATLTSELADAGLARALPDPGCSEYHSGHAGLLDHIAVRGETVASAHVDGACRALACGSFGGETPAPFLTLSDHCPVSIDLPVP